MDTRTSHNDTYTIFGQPVDEKTYNELYSIAQMQDYGVSANWIMDAINSKLFPDKDAQEEIDREKKIKALQMTGLMGEQGYSDEEINKIKQQYGLTTDVAGSPEKFDLASFKDLKELEGAVSLAKLSGKSIDPMVEKLVEFNKMPTDTWAMANETFQNKSLGDRLLSQLNPIKQWTDAEENLKQRKNKFGADYDLLKQYQDYFKNKSAE